MAYNLSIDPIDAQALSETIYVTSLYMYLLVAHVEIKTILMFVSP